MSFTSLRPASAVKMESRDRSGPKTLLALKIISSNWREVIVDKTELRDAVSSSTGSEG